MAAADMASAQINMTCAICTEVFTSPRFLPCHHTFCLECLEQLANRYGNTIPCPTCRTPFVVPPGGVCDLQVNFYFTDEALEQARSDENHSKCPVHTKERVLFYCAQCDQAICMRCKLTKHDGHVTEDLSETASRCQQTIKQEMHRLEEAIAFLTNNVLECLKENEKRAREKRNGISKQIQDRFDFIVAMAQEYRYQAQQQLEEISDSLEEEMAADTQRVQGELDSLLQLKNRTTLALTSASDTEVLQVEKEITKGKGSFERLKELEDRLPDRRFCPGLHGDYTNDIKEDIKRFIGTPVRLDFPIVQNVDMECLGQCDDWECREVHALRQREDKSIDVIYGGTGGDFSKEIYAIWRFASSKVIVHTCETRMSCVTRKPYIWEWKDSEIRTLGSKSTSVFGIFQDYVEGLCCISPMELKEKDGKEISASGEPLLFPGVKKNT
ncbi:tripartite motif-containing protein 2-like isoform X2 [Pomacea canaliculata]|nr:tripartite motif-containing protein 2-like isoform X2 [Pomacea canaliculata]XP_025082896.1 tripartite motif-containing protein 2-like isoform X2 [Pomacea canaliculata]